MQIAGNRRGRRHGARQPEMERELCAFGERTQQDQRQHGTVQRMRPHLFAGVKHHIQVITAGNVPEQHDAGQHGQPACCGDRECGACAAAGILAVMPVANQQKGEQAGQLPEKHQLDQVSGSHHADHRAHERQKQREEARHGIFARHVVPGVNGHEQADASHQQSEHPRKTIQPQQEMNPGIRQPALSVMQNSVCTQIRPEPCHQNQAGTRHQGRPGGGCIAGMGWQQGCHGTTDKWQRQQEQQGHACVEEGRRDCGGPPQTKIACRQTR